MTTSLYIQCIAMFLLGQGVDLFLMKIPEYRTLYRKANEDFSWGKYWSSDWNVIVGTILFGAICVIGTDQILNLKPSVLYYIKWVFAGLGGMGSAIIVSKWSSCKKYIMDVIDKKTNISDSVTNNG